MIYIYDFGDDWRHTIKVERRFSAELWEDYPRLVDAKGRCPPEDVGGPWGYAEYLDAMSDPTHTRHAELIALSRAQHRIHSEDPSTALHQRLYHRAG